MRHGQVFQIRHHRQHGKLSGFLHRAAVANHTATTAGNVAKRSEAQSHQRADRVVRKESRRFRDAHDGDLLSLPPRLGILPALDHARLDELIAIGAERGIFGLHTRQLDFTGGGLGQKFLGRGGRGIFSGHGRCGRGRLFGNLALQRGGGSAQFLHPRMLLREARERLRKFRLHRAQGQRLRTRGQFLRQHRRAGHRCDHGGRDLPETRTQFLQAALCGGDLALAFLAAFRDPFIRAARDMRREVFRQHARRGGILRRDRRDQKRLPRLNDDLATVFEILDGNAWRQFGLEPRERQTRRDGGGKVRRLRLGGETAFKGEQANRSSVGPGKKGTGQPDERAEQREDGKTHRPRPARRTLHADGGRLRTGPGPLLRRTRGGQLDFWFLPGPHDCAI